jgi:hypothetical protein
MQWTHKRSRWAVRHSISSRACTLESRVNQSHELQFLLRVIPKRSHSFVLATDTVAIHKNLITLCINSSLVDDQRIAMVWVCQLCPAGCRWCSDRANEFDDLGDAIEHIRKHHDIHSIGRPGAVGCSDSHGHQWYCFDCETAVKDHRSFNSDEAMLQHLTACHHEYIKADMDIECHCPDCG